ncbi:hypothetical protein ACFU0W_06970 [Microbacterium keratanolyticum]|uniref:hypothetical protein n=1 Tax=Microbacterium keratanolyticum TaxID=67574 RepID=UPI00362F88F7
MPEHRLPARAVLASYLRGAPAIVGLVGVGVIALTNAQFWLGRWGVFLIGALLLARLLQPVFTVATLRYDLSDSGIRVVRGLLNRRSTSVSWAQVAVRERAQPWAYRMLHLDVLTLRVGGEVTADGVIELEGIEPAIAAEIVELAAQSHPRHEASPESVAEVPAPVVHDALGENVGSDTIYRATTGQLLVSGLVQGQVVVIGTGAVLAALDVVQQFGGWSDATLLQNLPLVATLAAAGIIVLGMLLAVVRFHGFEVARDGNRLVLSYGLIETQHRVVDAASIVGVRAHRNALEMLIDHVRIRLLSQGAIGSGAANAILPALPRTIAASVLEATNGALPVPALVYRSGRRALLPAAAALLFTVGVSVGAGLLASWLWAPPLFLALIAAGASALLVIGVLRLVTRRLSAQHPHLCAREQHLFERTDLVRTAEVHLLSVVSVARVRARGVRVAYFAGMPRSIRAVTRNHELLTDVRTTLGEAAAPLAASRVRARVRTHREVATR